MLANAKTGPPVCRGRHPVRREYGILVAEGEVLQGKGASSNTPLWSKYFIQDRGGLDVRLHLSRTYSGKSAGHAKPLITYRVFILHI